MRHAILKVFFLSHLIFIIVKIQPVKKRTSNSKIISAVKQNIKLEFHTTLRGILIKLCILNGLKLVEPKASLKQNFDFRRNYNN